VLVRKWPVALVSATIWVLLGILGVGGEEAIDKEDNSTLEILLLLTVPLS
jgi:hypothetical protein